MTCGRVSPSFERAVTMFLSKKRLIGGMIVLAALLTGTGFFFPAPIAHADSFDDAPSSWEPLLWGGKVATEASDESTVAASPPKEEAGPAELTKAEPEQPREKGSEPESEAAPPEDEIAADRRLASKTRMPDPNGDPPVPSEAEVEDDSPDETTAMELPNIPPLYVNPRLEGEGIWDWQNLPVAPDGTPLMYRTSYRPSVRYPNAIVHMLVFDMKRLNIRLYLGSSEPGGSKSASVIESQFKPLLVAVTNALWKQKHSGDGGTVFRGNVIRKLSPGVATIVSYKDGSTDILEWNDSIPLEIINDAKQLRHLIVRDGKVVDSVIKGGQRSDSEIGLGYLLVEDESQAYQQSYWGGYGGYYGGYYGGDSPSHTSGEDWFIATRSGFGIRPDGNLVFAIGHHISTKDLAKALVLAGCVRAVHGDANPHNCLANLYYNNWQGDLSRRAKLSPDQKSTLDRYVDKSYTSDYFGVFLKASGRES